MENNKLHAMFERLLIEEYCAKRILTGQELDNDRTTEVRNRLKGIKEWNVRGKHFKAMQRKRERVKYSVSPCVGRGREGRL